MHKTTPQVHVDNPGQALYLARSLNRLDKANALDASRIDGSAIPGSSARKPKEQLPRTLSSLAAQARATPANAHRGAPAC